MDDLLNLMMDDVSERFEKMRAGRRQKMEEQLDMVAAMAGIPHKVDARAVCVLYFNQDADEKSDYIAAREALIEKFVADMVVLAKEHFGDQNALTREEVAGLADAGIEAMRTKRGAAVQDDEADGTDEETGTHAV